MNGNELEKYTGLTSPVHNIDPRVKIPVFFLLIVVCVSTPPELFPAFAAYFAIIAITMLLSRVPLSYYLKRLLLVIPFVFLVALSIPFLPSDGEIAGSISYGLGQLKISSHGLTVFRNVMFKASISVMALSIVSATTPFPDFLKALDAFKVPKIFTMLAGFTFRYIFILVDEVTRMKRARDSRLYGGKWLWHAKVIGQMIGTLFLRSYERGERVYVAMVSRGYNGTYPSTLKPRLKPSDIMFASAMVTLFAVIRICSQWIP